jgi:hypothetical protein
MKQKEVEAVFGGKAEFENADSMASKLEHLYTCPVPLMIADLTFYLCSTMPRGRLQWRPCVLLSTADSKCRRTDDYILEGGCLPRRIPCILRVY